VAGGTIKGRGCRKEKITRKKMEIDKNTTAPVRAYLNGD